MAESPESRHEPGRCKERRRWLVYLIELPVAILCGLGLLGLLLLLLDVWFPGSSSLGELVRTPKGDERVGARLDFDNTEDVLVAVLSDVRNDVRDKPASSVVWNAAGDGKGLGDRHAVQSHAGSTATISFGDEHSLELGENTVIVVRKPRRVRGSERRRASALFMEGVVRARFGDDADGVGLELVSAAGTIRAAEGAGAAAEVALAVDDTGSALSVIEGSAELVWGEDVTLVPAGHMVTYDDQHPPSEPSPLPRPPRTLAPTPDARFRYRSSPPEIPFRWRPVAGVREYRLQVAADRGFTTIVHDTVVAATEFTHANLAAGEYYWRVASLRGPVASPASAPLRLVIDQDRTPPRLEVRFPATTVDDPVVTLGGVTEPGCRVLIADQPVAVGDDGGFRHELRLQSGYNFIVVQAIDATGNTAFRNQTVIAELADVEEAP